MTTDPMILLRARTAARKAMALGIDVSAYADKLEEIEAEIAKREREMSTELGWERKVQGWKERRVMAAAAYVAGASFRQLGRFLGITAPSVKELVFKELPYSIFAEVGGSRIGKGRAFDDAQVEAMLRWFHLNNPPVDAPVLQIAATMRAEALKAGVQRIKLNPIGDQHEDDTDILDSSGPEAASPGQGPE